MATAAVGANATHNASQQAPSASGEPEHPGSSAPSLDSQDSAGYITPSSQERIAPSASTKISLNPPKPFAGKGSDVEQKTAAVPAKTAAVLEVEQSPNAWVGWVCFYILGEPAW